VVKILLIDDDPDLTHFLRDALEQCGYGVECLDRGERGPALLAETNFDLVLLDNKMPGLSGIEFLAAMQERGIRVPVILMTGYATTDTAIQAMNLGAFDYVIKPMEFAELFRELQPLIHEALEIARPLKEVRLPAEIPHDSLPGPMMVGKSRVMVEVYKLIGRFSKSDDAVMILGETGTGKELVARAIHTNSLRKNMPFVALNCTALNETLLDDELFGHEPGAFTGAAKLRKGKFEHASGGTLFLDEIGDMPLNLQAKLLRLLEHQEVCRIGGNEVIKVDVRLLSATHRDLQAAIRGGTFRRDLFHRLNRVTVRLPSLRERLADLPELARYFLERAADAAGREAPTLTQPALDRLLAFPWPGNIRELQNTLHRASGVCRGPQILPSHLDLGGDRADDWGADFARNGSFSTPASSEDAVAALRQAIVWAWDTNQPKLWPLLRDLLERELVQFTVSKLDGNQTQAAERLDMARGTVIKRIADYGIK
jgi:DNA-binding NtrC family response regulator